jgi:hypothetical protein
MQINRTDVFGRSVKESLERCVEIINQRGKEYLDSWSDANLSTPFQDSLPTDLRLRQSQEYKRLQTIAAMCDVKLSRLSGHWKQDTGIDLVNYIAAFTALRGKLEGRSKNAEIGGS